MMRCWIICCVLLLAACHAMAQHAVTVQWQHTAGKQPLQLFDSTYHNAFNEPFTVNRFRYYISHLTLTSATGKQWQSNEHFLIDEEDSLSKTIQLSSIPFNNIATIEFQLGVDSIFNVSGVQTGTLDPMRGMFWTWNSGYIFAKLEGQSDSSKAPVHYFSYHVGGYKHYQNATRKVKLALPSSSNIHSILINADILQWFASQRNISIATSAICHEPGKLAMQLADNYATMFTIIGVQ